MLNRPELIIFKENDTMHRTIKIIIGCITLCIQLFTIGIVFVNFSENLPFNTFQEKLLSVILIHVGAFISVFIVHCTLNIYFLSDTKKYKEG